MKVGSSILDKVALEGLGLRKAIGQGAEMLLVRGDGSQDGDHSLQALQMAMLCRW